MGNFTEKREEIEKDLEIRKPCIDCNKLYVICVTKCFAKAAADLVLAAVRLEFESELIRSDTEVFLYPSTIVPLLPLIL